MLFQEIDYKWIDPADGEGHCLEITVKFFPAVSPAFKIDGMYSFLPLCC